MRRLAGKCDRKAVSALIMDACRLRGREQARPEPEPEPKPESQTPSEPGGCDPEAERVAREMERVLQLPAGTIGLDDDFFASGGHSVAAVRLCAGLSCRVADLLAASTPRALAAGGRLTVDSSTKANLHEEVLRARRQVAAELPAITLVAKGAGTVGAARAFIKRLLVDLRVELRS